MSDFPLDWFAARFVVHMASKSHFKITKDLVSDHFFSILERILKANSNFTTINYLLELVSIFDRTIKRPHYLNSMPSVRNGSKEILNYLNNTSKVFHNVYQLNDLRGEDHNIHKSFSKGDIILLQVLETTLVFWFTSDINLVPHFATLSDLNEVALLDGTLVRLTFGSKIARGSRTTEMYRSNFSYVFETNSTEAALSLKQKLNPSKDIAGQTILSTEALEIDAFEDNVRNSYEGNWKDSLDKSACSISKNFVINGDTSDTTRPFSGSSETAKTKRPISDTNAIVTKYPKRLQEEMRRLGLGSLMQGSISRDALMSDTFAENSQKARKKYKESYIPIANSGKCHDEINLNIQPEKIKQSLQKVANTYGRKKPSSSKKDIWEFSSSTPSSPKISLPENSVKPINPLSGPGLLDLSNTSSPRKRSNELRDPEYISINESLVPIHHHMQHENGSLSEIPHKHVSATPSNEDEPLNNNLDDGGNILEQHSSEEINSCFSNCQSQRQNYYSSKDCCFPRMEEITTKKDGVVSTGNNNSSDLRHQRSSSSSSSAEKSAEDTSLLNSTNNTSFVRKDSSFATIEMNKHYGLLHESLNSFSSRLVQGVKTFEFEILKKEKEMQEQLDAGFEQVAKNHLANLKKLNDYAREKGHEILKELI